MQDPLLPKSPRTHQIVLLSALRGRGDGVGGCKGGDMRGGGLRGGRRVQTEARRIHLLPGTSRVEDSQRQEQ